MLRTCSDYVSPKVAMKNSSARRSRFRPPFRIYARREIRPELSHCLMGKLIALLCGEGSGARLAVPPTRCQKLDAEFSCSRSGAGPAMATTWWAALILAKICRRACKFSREITMSHSCSARWKLIINIDEGKESAIFTFVRRQDVRARLCACIFEFSSDGAR